MYDRNAWSTHPNGQGFVQYEAEIHPSCVLKNPAMVWAGSEIHGPAFVTGSTQLKGNNRILESPSIHGSTIDGRNIISGHSIVNNSQISGECVISCSTIAEHCVFTGQVRLRDRAICQHVRASGFTLIGGDAVVRNCEIEPGAIILSGLWYRSPRVVKLGWITVIEGKNNRVALDCEMRPAKVWLEKGPAIGVRKGMTELEVDQIRQAILYCIGEVAKPEAA